MKAVSVFLTAIVMVNLSASEKQISFREESPEYNISEPYKSKGLTKIINHGGAMNQKMTQADQPEKK